MKSTNYALIAVLAAAAGFGIYRFGLAPQTAPPEVEAPVARAEPGGLPEVLPEFVLTDREGEPRSIQSWPGKSMIVNFWATWCAPCRREIPLLKQIQNEHGDEGFQVVGIAVDFRDDVLEYADEMGINYPLLIGEQDGLDAVAKFGLPAAGFPFTVFTDTQSRIVLTHLGEITESQSKVLLDVVRQVNRGELTPESARAVAAKQLAAIREESPAA
jgi:thiol-disulfide isomerase/thioredoxin